jgi:hypothetical protein
LNSKTDKFPLKNRNTIDTSWALKTQ